MSKGGLWPLFLFMKPFSCEKCTFKTRLTILDRQVAIFTDSKKAHNFFNFFFGSRFFAPHNGQMTINFFMCTECSEPWSIAMTTPEHTLVALPSDDKPGVFNIFRHYPNQIEPCGQFSWEDIDTHSPSCTNSMIELCATYLKRRILDYLLKKRPLLRLIHAASVNHNKSGQLFLAPTKGGKTTLSLACTIAGMKFLSDDLSLVDLKRGLLLPFPRALRVREKLYKSLPEFKSIPAGLMIDLHGEKRHYIQPENIHKNALGEPVNLTHFIVLKDIKNKPFLREAEMASLPEILVESDCFAVENPAELVWQWMPIIDKVKCLELFPGPPMETADFLLEYLNSEQC